MTKFDRKRHLCLLTEDGLWHLTNERDRVLNIHLPKVRASIQEAQRLGKPKSFVNLWRQKQNLLKRVLWLNQRINYHVLMV